MVVLVTHSRLALNFQQSSYLNLPSAGITLLPTHGFYCFLRVQVVSLFRMAEVTLQGRNNRILLCFQLKDYFSDTLCSSNCTSMPEK